MSDAHMLLFSKWLCRGVSSFVLWVLLIKSWWFLSRLVVA